MSAENLLPVIIPASAWLTGLLTFLIPEPRSGLRNALNLGAAVAKAVLVVVLLLGVWQGGIFEARLTVLPGFDLLLNADAWSLLFLTLSTLLWLFTTIYAIGYLAHSHDRSRFFGFFGMCVGATAGISLAGNLLTFLVFYELLTLTTYPLVVHKGDPASLRAGRRYLAYTLFGGTLLLGGVVWLRTIAGPLEFSATGVLPEVAGLDRGTLQLIFVLLIAGLGVKAALVPLHAWLPSAMVAPAPVSALLHAVAVVKAGAFGIARVVYDVYGVEFAASLGLTAPLAVVAGATVIYGSVRALFQDNLKRRLAFSTVSQVSYIALGTATLGSVSTVGGIIHLVHQGLMKITLFFCAGNLDFALGVHSVGAMDGVGRRMPITMTAFTIGALGMIGVPPVAGFVSKWYLGLGAAQVHADWVVAVLVGSTLLNAAYFLPVLYRAWFRPPAVEAPVDRPAREAPWALLVPPLVTSGLALAAGMFAAAPFSPLEWARLIAAREYGAEPLGRLASAEAESVVLIGVLVPLLCAALAPWRRSNRLAFRAMPWAALPAVAVGVLVAEMPPTYLPWLFTGTVLELDAIGRTFLLFCTLLWLTAGAFALDYLRADPARGRFAGFYLLAMAANFGLVLAADPVSFFVFFTVMTFAGYGLIIHNGSAASLRAGRIYLVLAVIGEVCLYSALVFAFGRPGDIGPAATGLLLVGFGIKAAMLPLHVWLPLAHPVAPAPASAVLSGAMVAAGLLGWLRFLPFGTAGYETWGGLLAALGLTGAFYAAVVGTVQREPKTVLAYSTVSQMGLMITGVGVALREPAVGPAALLAVAIYACHHGLAKGALFLGSAVAPAVRGAAAVPAWIALLLPALAIVGAPLTSGAVAKSLYKEAFAGRADDLMPLLVLAATGSTLLMGRFILLARPGSGAAGAGSGRWMWGAWIATVLLSAGMAWWLPGVPRIGDKLLTPASVFSQVWPVMLGIALLYAIDRRSRGRLWGIVPSGDLLVPLGALGARGHAKAVHAAAAVAFAWGRIRGGDRLGRPIRALREIGPGTFDFVVGGGAALAFSVVLLMLFALFAR